MCANVFLKALGFVQCQMEKGFGLQLATGPPSKTVLLSLGDLKLGIDLVSLGLKVLSDICFQNREVSSILNIWSDR